MKTLTIALILTVLGLGGVVAGEPEKKKAKDKKAEEKQEAITNETLKEKYGEPEPASPVKEKSRAEIIKKTSKPSVAKTDADRTARVAELKKEEERLNKRISSLKNPFLPKVPLTDEEKKAEEGKGADERVKMLEKRLAAIRDELSKLQQPPGRPS